ncbi:MAG: FAD binding domain-containing protein [Vicinamibacterales bacterium]
MYSAEFDYHRARSLAEAQQLLAAHPGAKLLAGGHSLIPLMKLRLATPEAVIDIGRVPELRGLSRSGNVLRIGALTTHAELAASADLRQRAAALAEAAAVVGDPAVRNRGTIGGNVAHADPASDLPTVLVALGATLVAVGPRGERTIEAADFFTGIMTTALGVDEILAAVLVPASRTGQGSAYVKFAHPASRYAVVGVAASVTVEKGSCTAVQVAVGGLVPNARRATHVERGLAGQAPSDSAIAAAAAEVRHDLSEVNGDIFASAGYRRAVAPVYVKRALLAAVARAS